jgi:1-acyl-sn-glycerol-3-phosphate acyltransferase
MGDPMAGMVQEPAGVEGLPRRSPLLIRLFARYVRHYVGRHFHTVRLAREPRPSPGPERPLIVYANHCSWWDPLACMIVATELFPDRKHYAPMDPDALSRYRFFGRLGFFGVEPDSMRGAVALLRKGAAILAEPGATLWITPQGRFADPRERPVGLKPGIGRLARRVGGCELVPLAVEYPFGEERLPEALLRFGTTVRAEELEDVPPDELTELLSERLEATQDALARAAIERDFSRFEVLLRGRAGIGGVYDLWRRLKAAVRGEHFRAAHGEEGR